MTSFFSTLFTFLKFSWISATSDTINQKTDDILLKEPFFFSIPNLQLKYTISDVNKGQISRTFSFQFKILRIPNTCLEM